VAEDTGARVLAGVTDDLDDELARELAGVRDDDPADGPGLLDPHTAPEDSALLDDPWEAAEEHDDYWDAPGGRDGEPGTGRGPGGGRA
jgi:hypothetical protein